MLAAVSELESLVLRGGAVVGALVVIVGAIAAVLRFTTKRFVESVNDAVNDRLDRIEANTNELKPNGGSSVADAIARLEARQVQIQGETLALRMALQTHLADHAKLGY